MDTSSFIGYLQGEEAEDVNLVRQAIVDEMLVMPPFVVTELFSARDLSDDVKSVVLDLPQIPLDAGFWARAGEARALVLGENKRARTLDTMIAVFCIDHGLPLIARDGDYRHFVEHLGLVLRPGE